MDWSDTERELRETLAAHAASEGLALNPDEATVRKVVKALLTRKSTYGELYCPCRLVTERPELDANIICPCRYHRDEIAERGICHCRLFVSKRDEAAE